jgi:hypothetical protein
MSNAAPTSTTKDEHYVASLQTRLDPRSDRLEESHLEAAIDAQLTDTHTEDSLANPVVAPSPSVTLQAKIFDDYVNPCFTAMYSHG